MDVLGDLVSRDRRSERPAVRAPSRGRDYSYRNLCTTAWKAGNVLRFFGAREGRREAVTPDPAPEAMVSFLGAALLGAAVTFDPSDDGACAVVGESRQVEALDPGPGTKRLGFGDPPEDPAVVHWEEQVWSENPAFPRTDLSPGDTAVVAGGRSYDHRDLLRSAEAAGESLGLDRDSTVAVRAPLSEPGAVVVGVLAPLLAGATVAVPSDPGATDSLGADVGVGTAVPEPVAVDPDDWP